MYGNRVYGTDARASSRARPTVVSHALQTARDGTAGGGKRRGQQGRGTPATDVSKGAAFAARESASALRGRAAVAAGCLLLSLALQLLAGPPLAALLWRRRQELTAAAGEGAAAAERLLREQYNWLATATPAGVKLHGELCALLAVGAHVVLDAAVAAARALWPRCAGGAAAAVALATALTGVGGGLAALHDLLGLAAAPLSLTSAAAALLLRRHVGWLALSWSMLRGTWRKPKRRPWRGGATAAASAATAGAVTASPAGPGQPLSGPGQKADGTGPEGVSGEGQEKGRGPPGLARIPLSRLESLLGLAPDPGSAGEVVVEQVLVGVLLAVPLAALLPTTAAWRVLTLAAASGPAAARAALAAAAGLLRDCPLVALAWRWARPLDFPGLGVDVVTLAVAPSPKAGQEMNNTQAAGKGAAAHAQGRGHGGMQQRDAGPGRPACYLVRPLALPWSSVVGSCLQRGWAGGWGRPDGGERPAAAGGGVWQWWLRQWRGWPLC
ncbi:hypothetical protein HYH03_000921 [Edaphochlamys debaryana]|uniref:Uncharacterized protein n=1 Tax=Edaphochlamys debaryana TaxID=47281 RepID=A0A836C6G3_9CHLO|nr:hypothetical protein HYH03_000921 [Edaphochlamys debaryana]|eukprot:KAG2501103.1 hypothetical protein HYH03_000921 [Edaphochlamys debaryana]